MALGTAAFSTTLSPLPVCPGTSTLINPAGTYWEQVRAAAHAAGYVGCDGITVQTVTPITDPTGNPARFASVTFTATAVTA